MPRSPAGRVTASVCACCHAVLACSTWMVSSRSATAWIPAHSTTVASRFGISSTSRTGVRHAQTALSGRHQQSTLRCSAHPLQDAVQAVRTGQTSAEQLVRHSLHAIQDRDAGPDGIASFLSVQGEEAVTAAQTLDRRIAQGDVSGRQPLLGVPFAVKDNICTLGIPTTAASKVLENYRPSYDATVVSRLKAAGAIIIGKTNLDEFAMGSTTETSGYQVTRNPRSLEHAPGGSSGGSAAAVASGMVLASLGTDTGGSVRQPAAWCGVVGLKPSYGRVSRKGLIAYASSTDCIGPIATTVADAAAVFEVIAGPDRAGDATSVDDPVPSDLVQSLEQSTASSNPLRGLRIGLIKQAFGDRVQPDVAQAVREATHVVAGLGAEIVEVSMPMLAQQCAAYYVNVLSEASANLARFDGIRYGSRRPTAASAKDVMLTTRHDGFGDEVKQRIILGTFSLSAGYSDAYYKKAQRIRDGLRADFAALFKDVDALICPTAPTTAYRLGEFSTKGVASYADDLFTVPASLAGLPALSLPCGVGSQGLPIGMQIIADTLQEELVLRIGHAYEQHSDWHRIWAANSHQEHVHQAPEAVAAAA